jgi:hypothetical protein
VLFVRAAENQGVSYRVVLAVMRSPIRISGDQAMGFWYSRLGTMRSGTTRVFRSRAPVLGESGSDSDVPGDTWVEDEGSSDDDLIEYQAQCDAYVLRVHGFRPGEFQRTVGVGTFIVAMFEVEAAGGERDMELWVGEIVNFDTDAKHDMTVHWWHTVSGIYAGNKNPSRYPGWHTDDSKEPKAFRSWSRAQPNWKPWLAGVDLSELVVIHHEKEQTLLTGNGVIRARYWQEVGDRLRFIAGPAAGRALEWMNAKP